jgi:hypothetical protein
MRSLSKCVSKFHLFNVFIIRLILSVLYRGSTFQNLPMSCKSGDLLLSAMSCTSPVCLATVFPMYFKGQLKYFSWYRFVDRTLCSRS